VGVINLIGRSGPGAFSAGDMKLLSAIASQIGAAVENNRLIAESLSQERVVREMELAHDLQLKLLPPLEQFAGYAEVAARCVPAESVGGDFYHLFRLSNGRLGVLIGDVSSHGFGAALIMALTISAVAIHASEGHSPAEVLHRTHLAVSDELENTEMYLTIFYAVIDPAAGTVTYSNAATRTPSASPGDGAVERLGATDPPFGILEGDTYGEAVAPGTAERTCSSSSPTASPTRWRWARWRGSGCWWTRWCGCATRTRGHRGPRLPPRGRGGAHPLGRPDRRHRALLSRPVPPRQLPYPDDLPRAKRSLGQNFLVDPNLQRKIADAIDPTPDDEVMEIGPGHGRAHPAPRRARAAPDAGGAGRRPGGAAGGRVRGRSVGARDPPRRAGRAAGGGVGAAGGAEGDRQHPLQHHHAHPLQPAGAEPPPARDRADGAARSGGPHPGARRDRRRTGRWRWESGRWPTRSG
jgi:hypothetical protein